MTLRQGCLAAKVQLLFFGIFISVNCNSALLLEGHLRHQAGFLSNDYPRWHGYFSVEFELIGKWIFEDGKVVEDETAQRINYLKDNYLEKIIATSSGWEILYRDPSDMRYWELTFSQSGDQGGGPPTLYNISKEIAIEKYDI